MTLKKFFLRFQNRLYVSVLVFLGMTSVPFIHGCGNAREAESEQQRVKDSIATAQHQLDSISKVKEDSIATAAALREKAIQDSIRIADSIAKAKKHHKPVNPYRPVTPTTKYGVRPVDRNE